MNIAGLERCDFDDECDSCNNPQDVTEAEFYICHDCIYKALDQFIRPTKQHVLTPEGLDALRRAWGTAMHYTAAARIPECGQFGAIAQDLDYVINTFNSNT